MKRALAAITLGALATLAPITASAEPHTLYEFKVLSWGCSIEQPGGYCGGGSRSANGLRVGLSALSGSITVRTLDWPWNPFTTYHNNGVQFTDFLPVGTPVDMNAGLCKSSGLCEVSASFQVDELLSKLTGSFSSLNGSDMFGMTSGPDALWTGYYRSDDGHSLDLYRTFAGVWLEIPEPSSIAMIGAGLIGLIGLRRRKMQAQGVSAS